MLTGYESKAREEIVFERLNLGKTEDFGQALIAELKVLGAFYMLVPEGHPNHHTMVRRAELNKQVQMHNEKAAGERGGKRGERGQTNDGASERE